MQKDRLHYISCSCCYCCKTLEEIIQGR